MLFSCTSGNYEGAVEVYRSLESNVPGLAMVNMRRINLERRQGNNEKTESLYRERIESASQGQEKSFYVIKYARYLAKVSIYSMYLAKLASMAGTLQR